MTKIDLNALDLIWGAEAISRTLGVTTSKAFHLLEAGKLPAMKVGRQWVTSRSTLTRFFAPVLETELAE